MELPDNAVMSWGQPRISDSRNPMLNEVVLTRFFELCELSDLPTLRSVSKQWYELSLTRFRKEKRPSINFMNDDGHVEPLPPPHRERRLNWRTLGEKLDVAFANPFRSFRLYDVIFTSFDVQKKPVASPSHLDFEGFQSTCVKMEIFWNKYGPWIHKLELLRTSIADTNAFKKVLFEKLPNLQEFTWKDLAKGDFNFRPRHRQMVEDDRALNVQPQINLNTFIMLPQLIFSPLSWQQIFAHFPNIQKIGMFQPQPRIEMLEFMESFIRLGTNPQRLGAPITHLTLFDFQDHKSLLQLFRLPFVKLEKLDLDVERCDRSDSDVLATALHKNGQTLKELSVRSLQEIWTYDNFPFRVDPFPTLTTLELVGTVVRNLHFLEQFPNLTILHVEQVRMEKIIAQTNWRRMGTLCLGHLQEFVFMVNANVGYYISEEIMERFVVMMPNVKRFTAQLSNSSLRVVCRNWRDLWKLQILSGWIKDVNKIEPKLDRIDDEGITGILPGSEKRLPSILDLQRLRYLTLEHTVELTESSIFEGFLKLPHLLSLHVWLSHEVGFEGLSALYRQIPRKGSLKTFSTSPCTCQSSCLVHGSA